MSGAWDPTGTLVVGMRADGDVTSALEAAGATPGDTYHVSVGEPKRTPPHVVVVPQGSTDRPFGLASTRLGLRRHQYAFRCVAQATLANGKANTEAGAQATAIALAVVQFLARQGFESRVIGPDRFATGAPREDNVGPFLVDPDSKDAFVLVTGSLVATAQAIG